MLDETFVKATYAAVNLANKNDIDITEVIPASNNEVISKSDVEKFVFDSLSDIEQHIERMQHA